MSATKPASDRHIRHLGHVFGWMQSKPPVSAGDPGARVNDREDHRRCHDEPTGERELSAEDSRCPTPASGRVYGAQAVDSA